MLCSNPKPFLLCGLPHEPGTELQRAWYFQSRQQACSGLCCTCALQSRDSRRPRKPAYDCSDLIGGTMLHLPTACTAAHQDGLAVKFQGSADSISQSSQEAQPAELCLTGEHVMEYLGAVCCTRQPHCAHGG